MGRIVAILGIPLVMAVAGLALASRLPAQLDMLWGADGAVAQSLPRAVALALVPLVALILGAGLTALARLWRDRFEGDSLSLAGIAAVAMQVALLAIWLAVLAHNAGWAVAPPRVGAVVAAAALFGAGLLVARADRNPMLGVRTRHTLADREVWAETNRRVALWLRWAAALPLVALIRPDWLIWLVLVPATGIAIAASMLARRLYHARHGG